MTVILLCGILWTFLVLSQGCSTVTDPCYETEYMALPNQDHRCPTCGAGTGCDKFIATNSWYRFNYAITTSPLSSPGQCGTNYPIWMNGAFPSMSDGPVDRQACLVTFDSDCETEYSIMVRNCTFYNVYCMKETPSSCNARFCFESPNLVTTTSTTTSATTTTIPALTSRPPPTDNDYRKDGHTHVQYDDDKCDTGIRYVVLTLAVCVIAFSAILIAIVYHFKRRNHSKRKGSVYVQRSMGNRQSDYPVKVINTKSHVITGIGE